MATRTVKFPIGTLVWVQLSHVAFLGIVQSRPNRKGEVYIFFVNSWEDLTPHGGGLYGEVLLRAART